MKVAFLFLSIFFVPAFAYANFNLSKIQYGKSFMGKNLIAYKIFKKGNFTTRKAVLITEGVHGNEYMGIVEKMPMIFHESDLPGFQEFISGGGILLIVPQINPDGVERKSRFTMMNMDLNRDFDSKKLHEQESYLFSLWIKSELQNNKASLILAVDYHCCKGAMIHPQISSEKNSFLYQKKFEKINLLMRKHVDQSYQKGTTKVIFGNKTTGTLKDYLFQEYGTLSLTFEGISMDREGTKLNDHVKWWDSLFTMVKELSLHSQNKLN